MNKFEKSVSVLAVMAMVNPTTIVSAATTNQPIQSNATQSKSQTATKAKPVDQMHYLNNMFVTSPSNYIAYSGMGKLDLRLYSNEHTQYLSRVYIVMPKGLTVDGGLATMRAALKDYRNAATIHVNGDDDNDGTLTIQQLANTSDGREVYEVIPGTNNYVVIGENPSELPMTIPIRSADKSSGLTQILMNANTKADIAQDVLFAGAGDGQNVVFHDDSSYPKVAAQDVGIIGPDDQYVHGIASSGYQRTITFFTPKVVDKYQVVDPYQPETVITSKSTTGASGTPYTRVGFVDTLASLGLDPAIYDEKSLTIDRGQLNDPAVVWTPINGFTDDPSATLEGQTYTIAVKRFAKDVTVKYVDQNGKTITDATGDTTETLSGDVGDDYQSTQKDLAGYTFKKVEGNAAGQFSDSAQTVTYHYAKKAANVTVKYVDQDGKTITDATGDTTETLTGDLGDNYQSTQKDIAGYAFKKVDGATTGPFTDSAQTVTYHYAKEAANVTVKYVDQDGKTITDAAGDTTETLKGYLGDDYQSTQKDIAGYTFKKVDGATTGPFTDSAQTVTYHYAKKAANVTVKYVDQDGKTITDATGDTTEILTGDIGEDYQATQKVFAGYSFESVTGTPTGPFMADAQTVTYHYAKIAADVTVKYEDEFGNRIAEPVTLSGHVGESYHATQAKIAGYTFKAVQGTPDGTFGDAVQTVTYVYTKDLVKAADVTVKYQDEAGNQIATPETLSGNVGDPYHTMQKAIAGYHYQAVTGITDGLFSATAQTVTYIYAKDPVKAADVTVTYEDEGGQSIASSETLTGNVGDPYKTVQKKIAGYTIKEVPSNAAGAFGDAAQTVTYVYTKDLVKAADVTVNYQDEAGNQIATSETLSGNVGESYHAVQKAVTGYTFKEVTGQNETGTFSDKAQTVTYVYTKDAVKAADVTVNYEDELGNQIADSKTLTGNIGEAYQTVQATIAGYTFKQVNGDATGQFGDKTQTVTYIYTKDPVQTGNVTVNYQDEAGHQLAKSVTLTGNIGANYQAVQLVIDGYTLKKVIGNPNGKLTDAAQMVTYVYAKTVTQPKGPTEQPKQPAKQPQKTIDQTASDKSTPTPKTTKNRQQLPQTGVKQVNGLLATVGVLLIAMVGMVFKKRRN